MANSLVLICPQCGGQQELEPSSGMATCLYCNTKCVYDMSRIGSFSGQQSASVDSTQPGTRSFNTFILTPTQIDSGYYLKEVILAKSVDGVRIDNARWLQKIVLSSDAQKVSVSNCKALLAIVLKNVQNLTVESCEVVSNIEFIQARDVKIHSCPKLSIMSLASVSNSLNMTKTPILNTSLNNSLTSLYLQNCNISGVLKIPASVSILSILGCDKLKSISFAQGHEKINGISGNNHLTTVYLPPSVKFIEERAFSGCIRLRKIHSPNRLISFAKNETIGANPHEGGVTLFWDNSFYNCNLYANNPKMPHLFTPLARVLFFIISACLQIILMNFRVNIVGGAICTVLNLIFLLKKKRYSDEREVKAPAKKLPVYTLIIWAIWFLLSLIFR